MEQLVLLLIIGAISLINWLIEQSGKRREMRRLEMERSHRETEESVYRKPTTDPVAPTVDTMRSREMRRFLESFGVPLPEEMEAPAVETKNPEISATFIRENLDSETQQALVALKQPKPLPIKEPVCQQSKAPANLRQAILWREVLGPPRSINAWT